MKKLPWRSAFYLLVLVYLLVDLKFCNGPLKRKLAETRPSSAVTREKARQFGWVALVNQEPVTQTQLNLAVSRYLYQRGQHHTEINDQSMVRVKRATLRGLIDDVLIRQYADGVNFEASEQEKQAFVKSWESQFHSADELKQRTEFQGLTTEERTRQLGKIWSRKRWLEKRISPGVGVSDDEAKTWYDQNKDNGHFTEPERIRARQIFISTVEEDSEKQETLIRQARERIASGEEFEKVARALSQDARTKDRGGDLNWFSKQRLSEQFTGIVFAQETGQLGEPFKTDIGWHLVEVTDRKPSRPADFEDIKDEVRTHLLNEQKVLKVNELLGKLRKVANIIIFTENLN